MRGIVWFGLVAALVAGCAELGGIEEKQQVSKSITDGGPDDAAPDGAFSDAATPGYYDLDRPGRPPSRPLVSPNSFNTSVYLAMRRFYFGTSKRGTDERDPEAWRAIGWDLDGINTTADGLKSGKQTSCAPADSPQWGEDGKDGRDNPMGASFFQFVGNADPKGEFVTNEGLEKGASTLVLVLDQVNDWENDSHVVGAMYVTTHDLFSGPTPKWDGNDVRRLSSVSFWPNSTAPLATFPNGYISNGIWVSGDQHQVDLTLQFPFYPNGQETDPVVLRIRGRSGWATANIAGGKGGAGTFGFTCTYPEFRDTFFEHVRKALNCLPPSGTDNVLSQFKAAVDTRQSYTWDPNPTEKCDSISWGFDAEWAPVAPVSAHNPVVEPLGKSCDPP